MVKRTGNTRSENNVDGGGEYERKIKWLFRVAFSVLLLDFFLKKKKGQSIICYRFLRNFLGPSQDIEPLVPAG